MRFIRVHGRVVPIKDGAASRSQAQAAKPKRKAPGNKARKFFKATFALLTERGGQIKPPTAQHEL